MQLFVNQLLMIMSFCKPLEQALSCGNGKIDPKAFAGLLDDCSDRFFKTFNEVIDEMYGEFKAPDVDKKIGSWITAHMVMVNGTWKLPYVYRGAPIRIRDDDEKFELELPLSLNGFKVEYNYRVTVGGVGPSGSFTGTVDNSKGVVQIEFDYKTFTINASAVITDPGHMNPIFHGWFLTRWMLQKCSNVAVYFLETKILKAEQDLVDDFFQRPLKPLNKEIKKLQEMHTVWSFFNKLIEEGRKQSQQ